MKPGSDLGDYERIGVLVARKSNLLAVVADLKYVPLFNDIRSEPRFQALIERFDFPEQRSPASAGASFSR